ncbi:2OG-Fe(II) oxygenase [Bdellovibrio sp. HCB337]|uniref:2OG-Fe(II) oxygenase n=1 Tax=Bdellovibrio sp. HCB337 TaxID=3394358 RepID=UPI0039A668AC
MNIKIYSKPYTYFVIENFLPEEEYQSLKKASLETVHWESSPEYHDNYGMIGDASVLRRMLGPQMKDLLSDIVKNRVQRFDGSVPQLRRTFGTTEGLEKHTDETSGFELGVFLHLTDWEPNMGGELQIWSRSQDSYQLENEIAPKGNTLVGMIFSQDSYHSVTAVTKPKERLTLLTEWKFA